MADPKQFLERWSRLKRVAAQPPAAPPAATAPAPGVPAPVTPTGEKPLELPPIESLTKDSDFAPFLRPGVPEVTRNAALRKLWASDPVFSHLDGLLEYGEDFGAPFRLGGVVKTVYRVLEGMPGGGEPPVGEAETPAEPVVDKSESPNLIAAAAVPAGDKPNVIEPAPEPAAAPSGRRNKDGLG